jgi:hypothetical protein
MAIWGGAKLIILGMNMPTMARAKIGKQTMTLSKSEKAKMLLLGNTCEVCWFLVSGHMGSWCIDKSKEVSLTDTCGRFRKGTN